MIEIVNAKGKIRVRSQYNKYWIDKAKSLGGRWLPHDKVWEFSEEKEDIVKDSLFEIYGENGSPVEKVKVNIDLDVFDYDQELDICGIVAAIRPSRDAKVILKNGAYLISGSFLSSGGSSKYPSITAIPGTIVRLEIPISIYMKVKDVKGITLVNGNKDMIDKLEKEREMLLERIKEIDIELFKLK